MPSPTALVALILAHQGGWDEILMVAGPVLLMWLVLRAANRRAHRLADATEAGDAAGTPTSAAGDEHADLERGEVSPSDRPSPRER